MLARCWRWSGTPGIAAVALATVLATGCNTPPASVADPGRGLANTSQDMSGALSIALVVPPNFQINTISYQLMKTGFSQAGSLNVAGSGAVSAVVGGIPAGTGYTLALTANDVSGKFTSCAGSSTVSVTGGATTPVSVAIDCHLPPVAVTTPPQVPIPMPAVALLALALLGVGAVAGRPARPAGTGKAGGELTERHRGNAIASRKCTLRRAG